MFSGPSFSKPVHQYGKSSGDQAEVLDGGQAEGLECEFGCMPMDHGEDWAGQGFVPYQEPEGE